MALSLGIGPDHDPPMFDQVHRPARAHVRSDVPAPRSRMPEHLLLGLQRTAGNAAVAGLFGHPTVQRFWPFDDEEDEESAPSEDEEPEQEPEQEEEEDEEKVDKNPSEQIPNDPDDGWVGDGAFAVVRAHASPGQVYTSIGPRDAASPSDLACAHNPATFATKSAHARSYECERIPADITAGGSGALTLAILPDVEGAAIVVSDTLDLVSRQVLRFASGLASPDIKRIRDGSGPEPTPGGGPSPTPGGGPASVPGGVPVSPGGGQGPGGIPGMEPVAPGGAGGPASARPMLRKGSTGEDVRQVQELLVRRGAAIDPDGDFGSGTQRAVIDFQRSETLGADGIVGPLTWKALEAG